MSKFGEIILRKMSRDPRAIDYVDKSYERKQEDADFYVKLLRSKFLGIDDYVDGKRVLDIGCAHGMEAFALSKLGAKEVVGIDIRIPDPYRFKENGIKCMVMDAEHTDFQDNSFDVAISCGSFEHFNNPEAVMREMYRVIVPDGIALITSGVWAHPYGAHMNFFVKIPWIQYLFSEKTIMSVRKLYRNDGAERFHEVERGLNKIGIKSFKEMAQRTGFKMERLYLNPVRGMSTLTKFPYLNEFFTNLIIAVLRK